MDKTQALEKLSSIGQQHILNYLERLPLAERKALFAQIDLLNVPVFKMQQQMLKANLTHPISKLEAFDDYRFRGNPRNRLTGQHLIAQGKAGVILVAGGQGTRLKMKGPKGMFPISVIKKKSLFGLFAEKVKASGKLAKRNLPIAIMTSHENDGDTRKFFERHAYFHLSPEQISFFIQGSLPILNEDGNLFLDHPAHFAEGPNGNGSALSDFYRSGIWDAWKSQGVEYVNFVLVDNPLADPFDAELFGFHHNAGGEAVIKCTLRRDPEEKVGVIVKHENTVKVIEYSELPESEKHALQKDGTLAYKCANLSLFSFKMEFIKKTNGILLPLHLARKAIPYLEDNGQIAYPEKPNAWKFERFIFDLLPLAANVKALLYPREECFAPLKNLHGEASPEEVQQALQSRDRAILTEITHQPPPDAPFELSQEFYYPTEKLLRKWKGKEVDKGGYITVSD